MDDKDIDLSDIPEVLDWSKAVRGKYYRRKKMKVINLFGGPGSGKSTSAAALFAYLKNRGIKAELVGEEAKDQIYWGSPGQLENQFLLGALQYTRLKNLEKAGCQIAVSDSPLEQSPSYGRHLHYYKELLSLVHRVNAEFENHNVFVVRLKEYSNFGRIQTADEAKEIDALLRSTIKFEMEILGNETGQRALGEWVLNTILAKG